MKKILILASQPTPNGDLHLGHLAGPFIRSDIYRRFAKMLGREVYLVSGVDEHQSYIAVKAEQIGLTPQNTVDKFTTEIVKTLSAARIHVDLFARPNHLPGYQPTVERLFRCLQSGGKLIEREEPCLFCDKCDLYLFEALVTGMCPHCGERAPGNSCEACGQPNRCSDLENPVCNRCGGAPGLRRFKRLYMPLAPYEKHLRRYHEAVTLPSHARALCEQMMDAGLPEIPITHPSNGGLPAPGYPGQGLYGWFTLVPGLLAITGALAESIGEPAGWQRFWKEDDVEIVKFFGFDNAYFYALFFPAVFQAFDSQIRLPRALLMNEFYRLDDDKFSTSRNHAIWGRQLLEEEPPDLVRFYLSYTGPEVGQTSFRMAEYREFVKCELLKTCLNWLQELGGRITGEYKGVVPAPAKWTGSMHCFYDFLKEMLARAAQAYHYQNFSPQQASRLLLELIRTSRCFGQSENHWKYVPSHRLERDTAIALELAAAKLLALISAPIMPDFAASLWRDLGQTVALETASWPETVEWIVSGTHIENLGRSYFRRHENTELSPDAVGAYL